MMEAAKHLELAKQLLLFLRDRGNPQRSFALLRQCGRVLVPNYRFQWPEFLWWYYTKFDDYLRRFNELEELNTDRKWMLSELIRLVEGVEGDTAECGVWEGASSYLICHANRRHRGPPRDHYMFDSFSGLSDPGPQDGQYWKAHDLTTSELTARNNLAEFERVHYLTGWIPDRFKEVADRRFAFLHIDVDLHDPTRACLDFFYPRMNPGGIIVCDDYGSRFCPGATKAVDDFLADKPEKMLEMSGGGGFLIRGALTLEQGFRGESGPLSEHATGSNGR